MLQVQRPNLCSQRNRHKPGPTSGAGVNRRQVIIVNVKGPSPTPPVPPATNETTYVEDAFRKSVDVMLHRAASSLKRGTCTCLSCRGGGNVECAHCKGTGRLTSEAAERAGLLRGALLRLRTAVGLPPSEVPYASSGWMRTNRCPRCHGVGRLACEPCGGSGQRFPHQPDRRTQ